MSPDERARNVPLCAVYSGIGEDESRRRRERTYGHIAAEIREAEARGREAGYDEANKDFNWLQSAVAKIYCYFTDNKLSKWNCDPDVVIAEIEECQNKYWDGELDKAKAKAYEDAAKIIASLMRIAGRDGATALRRAAEVIRARAKEFSA